MSRSRKVPIPYDRPPYQQRHRIENEFGRLKEWGCIALRSDRRAHTLLSAICLAAVVLFWVNGSRPEGWRASLGAYLVAQG